MSRLLVVGAGPKALALAAKAQVLRELGVEPPGVVAVDKHGIAAHWDGSAGFTDGLQLLATPPEKDVGFPYRSAGWGKDHDPEIDERMLRFSWQQYKIGQEREPYSTWVDRGRPYPTLKEWSEYLKWVGRKAQLKFIRGRVERIEVTDGGRQWLVQAQEGESKHELLADGLVITGPGVPAANQPEGCYNPINFWDHLDDFRRDGLDVCIVGGGLTAASLVSALLDHVGRESRLTIISPHGFLYSRGESRLENVAYSDPAGWQEVSEGYRQEFLQRLDRGVFPASTLQKLDLSGIAFKCIPGKVDDIGAGEGGRLEVKVLQRVGLGKDAAVAEVRQNFDRVVDGRNTDRFWFKELFSDEVRARFSETVERHKREDEDLKVVVRRAIDPHLKLEGFTPNLHLPMLANVRWGRGSRI